MKRLFLVLFFNICAASFISSEPLTFRDFSDKYQEANVLYSMEKYKEALDILDLLVRDDYAETYPSVYLSKALVLNYMGRYDEAKVFINKCIELQPYSLKPRLSRSIIYFGMKDYYNALEDVNYCIEKNPTWADAYHQRGLINMERHNYLSALDDFNSCINCASEEKPEYFSDRGFSYYYLQEFEKARSDFIASIRIKPIDDVCLCLINVCYKMQLYDEGIKYANILIDEGRQVGLAVINRDCIYLAQERYDEAKDDLESIKKDCENLSLYHKVYCIYHLMMGEKNLAAEEIKRAYELNKHDEEISGLKELLTSEKVDTNAILQKIFLKYR